MCTFAAKNKLAAAVTLVEWNWNCTGVETYPVSDQTLFSARAGVADWRMLDGMIEHFFAPFPSDFQLCSSHTPLTLLDLTLWRHSHSINSFVIGTEGRQTDLFACSPPPHLSHTGALALQGRLTYMRCVNVARHSQFLGKS